MYLLQIIHHHETNGAFIFLQAEQTTEGRQIIFGCWAAETDERNYWQSVD